MPFVPGTLKKVREVTGCSEEDAAKKVRKDVDTIRRWESYAYDDLPTLAQAKGLAKLYRYSAGVFLLPELPDFITVPEVHDFRTLPSGDNVSKEMWSRNLRYAIRQLEGRLEFAARVIQREESSYQAWVGSVDCVETSPETLARQMREMLGVNLDGPRDGRGVQNVLKAWIQRFEDRAGVFVFQTDNTKAPIETSEMRGLSMTDHHAPSILLNSKDSHTARIFTLFHEFAHLWIGAPGVSAYDEVNFRGALSEDTKIERYCNSVAGNALMPAGDFAQVWRSASRTGDQGKAELTAGVFSVSPIAAAVRAHNLRLVDSNSFNQIRDAVSERKPISESSSGGGGNYYATTRRNLGGKFIDLVLGEYYSDQITIKEAANLLDVKIPSFFGLSDHVGFKP